MPNMATRVVTEINDEIFRALEKINFADYPYLMLEYSTDGYGELIEFLGYPIWNSEDDESEASESEEAPEV